MEGFEWDEHNREKNWVTHGVAWKECEEIFEYEPLIIFEDIKHSDKEKRFIALGKTALGKKLHLVFTKRGQNIRVISARSQNKKERSFYEEKEN